MPNDAHAALRNFAAIDVIAAPLVSTNPTCVRVRDRKRAEHGDGGNTA
jgi:hypothetical protein